MVRRAWLIVLTTILFSAASAQADIINFARHGAWTAFGGTANDGKKVCGVTAAGGGKSFHLKYFEQERSLTVQMFNDDWNARPGIKVDLRMTFDRLAPWTATATAFHDSRGVVFLEFDIPVRQVDRWFEDFKASYRLLLDFPGANVKSWTIDLTGTMDISDSFLECLRIMAR